MAVPTVTMDNRLLVSLMAPLAMMPMTGERPFGASS